MGKNRYVGHRYIPIFENGWDKTRTYEPLTFVYYEGKTYVSRQLVPTNIEITDNDFWAFFMDNAPQIFTPTFTGQWEDKPYEPLSIVINNGNTYVSKQDVPVGTLLTDETYWLDLSTYYNQLFTEYETAEQERASAELLRVGNESLRVENDTKREIEITKIKDASFIKMQNSFKNGDFSKGTENWLANYATLANINGGVKISNDGSSKTMRLIQNLDVKSSYLYYLNFKYTEASQNYRITVRNMPNSQIVSGVSGTYSALGYTTADNVNFQIEFTGEVSSGNEIVVSNVILLNLTKIFGVGNEPSKTTLDWIIKENGYFDELTLKRDDIQQYEINQLRKAVIALGGTV